MPSCLFRNRQSEIRTQRRGRRTGSRTKHRSSRVRSFIVVHPVLLLMFQQISPEAIYSSTQLHVLPYDVQLSLEQ